MLRGILAIITASILFGITPSGNKYVLLSGMTSDCVLFYQVIVMIAGTALVMAVKHIPFRVPAKAAAKLLVLGVVCLAFGILLGGSITDVITFATDRLAGAVSVLFMSGVV